MTAILYPSIHLVKLQIHYWSHASLSIVTDVSDNAYACDPRIQRFKDEEKEKKLAQKKAKQDAAKQKQEEEERVRNIVISHIIDVVCGLGTSCEIYLGLTRVR